MRRAEKRTVMRRRRRKRRRAGMVWARPAPGELPAGQPPGSKGKPAFRSQPASLPLRLLSSSCLLELEIGNEKLLPRRQAPMRPLPATRGRAAAPAPPGGAGLRARGRPWSTPEAASPRTIDSKAEAASSSLAALRHQTSAAVNPPGKKEAAACPREKEGGLPAPTRTHPPTHPPTHRRRRPLPSPRGIGCRCLPFRRV